MDRDNGSVVLLDIPILLAVMLYAIITRLN